MGSLDQSKLLTKIQNEDVKNSKKSQFWSIKDLDNTKKSVVLVIQSMKDSESDNDFKFVIDRKTAKSIVEVLNKKFELDEVYKSIYRNAVGVVGYDIFRFIRGEIKLIDRIIEKEGLDYWGDLLDISTFYKIYVKYKNRKQPKNYIGRDYCNEVLHHFYCTFSNYWRDHITTPKEKFIECIMGPSLIETYYTQSQIDRYEKIIEKIIKEENFTSYESLLYNIHIVKNKYESKTDEDISHRETKEIFDVIKILEKYQTSICRETEMLKSLKPVDRNDIFSYVN